VKAARATIPRMVLRESRGLTETGASLGEIASIASLMYCLQI
jgi:hypothetical protein